MANVGLGRLSGKSCVVTGAAYGIGRATADLFAREGARLVITDIQEGPLTAFRDELRALPTPATEAAGRTSALRSWLGRHVHHSSRMPLGHPRRA